MLPVCDSWFLTIHHGLCPAREHVTFYQPLNLIPGRNYFLISEENLTTWQRKPLKERQEFMTKQTQLTKAPVSSRIPNESFQNHSDERQH
jgi:hypothetical protein